MLAQPETAVVFMLNETISLGRKLTAGEDLKETTVIACKSVKETSLTETLKWNVINPISEKPKFGRGTLKVEFKSDGAA